MTKRQALIINTIVMVIGVGSIMLDKPVVTFTSLLVLWLNGTFKE